MHHGLLVDAIGAGTLAKELPHRGGQSTSECKSEAARRNGAKGGRPREKAPRPDAGSLVRSAKRRSGDQAVPLEPKSGRLVMREAGKPRVLGPTRDR